jgi:hypothetical protein
MLQQHRKMKTVEDGIVFQDFLGVEQCAMLWPLGLQLWRWFLQLLHQFFQGNA